MRMKIFLWQLNLKIRVGNALNLNFEIFGENYLINFENFGKNDQINFEEAGKSIIFAQKFGL